MEPGPATKLEIISTAYTNVTAGQASGIITVQRQDEFNNPNTADDDVVVLLNATASVLPGFLNNSFRVATSPFNQQITEVIILEGNSTAAFTYYDERAGVKTLEVEDEAGDLAGDTQNITIRPDTAKRLRFLNEPLTLEASVAPVLSSPLVIQRVDQFTNPVTADPAMVIGLTGTSGSGQFLNAAGTAPVTTRTIAQNSSTVSVVYTDTVVGSYLVGAERLSGGAPSVPSVDAANQTITITAAPADRLMFEPATATITAGNVSDAFNVVRRDEFGNLADEDDEIVVTLDTASVDGEFREAVSTGTITTSVTLGAGIAQTPVRYFDTLAGIHSITGSYGTLDDALGTITVLSAPADKLVMITDARTITAGQVSDIITVQRQDEFDNPADQDGAIAVGLASSSGVGAFSAVDSGTPTITTINIAASAASANVYYTDTLAGAHNITFTANLPGNSTASVSQSVTVNPDQAFALNFSTPERTTVAGTNSLTMTVERRDQFGNLNTSDAAVIVNLTTSVPFSATFRTTGGALLSPPNQVTISQGTSAASFRYNNEMVGPGTHVITASANLPQTSSAFVTQNHIIEPGAADYLRVRGPDSTPTAGVTQTLSITAFDSFGNVAVGYVGEQTLRFAGAEDAVFGGAIPNVTDKDGTPQNIGETIGDGVTEDALFDFVNGVAQTDVISRGLMTLYRAGEFTITARAAANAPYAQLDAVGSNAFAVDVQRGDLADFQIQDEPDGTGAPIPDQDLRSGEELVLYVVAIDAYGNGLPDEDVEALLWLTATESSSVSGLPVVNIDPAGASEVTTLTGSVLGTVTIRAVISTTNTPETAPTGVITVVPGDVASVNVETSATNVERQLVPTQSISASSSITVYATLRDAAGNLVPVDLDDSDVDWDLVDITPDVDVDDLVPDGREAVFTGNLVGSAVIRATVNGSPGLDVFPSGIITVVAGAPAGLEIRRADAAATINVEAGAETYLRIRVFDANNNLANINGNRTVTFYGAAPAPDLTPPTVTNNGNTAIEFGAATAMSFSGGIMTHSPTGQGRMFLYDAGAGQDITATLTLPNATVIGMRNGGELTANVSHADLATYAVSLNAPQTNTVPFSGVNTATARDLYDNPVLNFSADDTPLTVTASDGAVLFTATGDNIIDDNNNVDDGVVDLTAYGMTYTGLANQNITFTVSSTTPAATGSATILVDGGPAQTLAVTNEVIPWNWPAGEQLINLQARDAQGNNSPGYAGPRTLVFGKSGSTLPAHLPYVIDSVAVSQTFGLGTTLNFDAQGQALFVPVGLFAAQPGVTVTFTDTIPPTGAADPLTGTFTVNVLAGGLDNFAFDLTSPQAVSEPFDDDNSLTPRDEYGNVAALTGADVPIAVTASSGGIVTFTAATNGDNTLVAADFNTPPGVADLTALGMVYAGATGNISFTATSANAVVGVSDPVVFESNTPTRLEIQGTGDPEEAGEPFALTVVARDGFGNITTGYTATEDLIFEGASNAPAGNVPQVLGEDFGDAVEVNFEGGIAAIADVTLVAAESAIISATIGGSGVGSDPAGNYTVTVAPGDADEVHLATAPDAAQTAGAALSPAPQVQLRDVYENVRTGDITSTVTASVQGPGIFTTTSTIVENVTGGVATFNNLTLESAGLYTLTFSTDAGPAPTAGVTFTVASAAAAAITLTGPATVEAGAPSDPFTLAVFDQYGNLTGVDQDTTIGLTTDASGTYTFTPSSPLTLLSGQSTIPFTYADALVGMKIVTATVSAGDAGITSQTASRPITVTGGAPAQVELTGPASAVAGTPSTPFTLTVKDALGNITPVSEDTTVTLWADSDGIMDFVPLTLTIDEGGTSAIFTYSDTEAGSSTVTATVSDGEDGLEDEADSHTLTIEPGPPTELLLETPPDPTQDAGANVAPAIELLVRDTHGNVTSALDSSVISVTVNGPGALSSGTSSQLLSGGAATFSDLTLNTAGLYSLTFSLAAEPLAVDTDDFTVEPGAADEISMSAGNAQTAMVGTALPAPLAVLVTDAFDNPIAGESVQFTVTSGGGVFATHAPVVTNASGIATSTAWTLGTIAGVNTANATSTGLTGSPVSFFATSTAGPAHILVVNGGDAQSATVNTAVAVPLSVRVDDVHGNPVAGQNILFEIESGGGAFGTSDPVVTNASGVATATAWTLGTVAGLNEATANAQGGPIAGAAVTYSATGTAGALDALLIQEQPSEVDENTAIDPGPEVALIDQYSNVLIADNSTTVSVATSGTFTGTSTLIETVVNGVATFDNLALTSAGTFTMTFSATGIDPVISDSFTVTAPP
ncbi:MAG: hypothetical protein WDZ49_00605 [Litorilinea sp.]